MDIEKMIKILEVDLISNDYQSYIDEWTEYYQGNVTDFHIYNDFDGEETVEKERLTLQMAKKVCEDWADYLWNPEAKITVDDNFQETLDKILRDNNFSYRFNESLELGFALGTMAIENKTIGDKVHIDFIKANNILPIYNNGNFAWLVYSDLDNDTFHVTIHNSYKDDKYLIENFVFFNNDDNELTLLDVDIMLETYNIIDEIEYNTPMIQIIKPAIANNLDFQTPYGISIYANALAELRTTDQAYTSLDNETDIGQMISFVTAQDLKNINGKSKFPNAKRFYKMEGDSTFANGLSRDTHSPTLRTDGFIQSLETNLNLLGRKVGFGDNAYTFTDGSIYINTAQVISTNSKFFKTRQKHLVGVSNAVDSMVRAIYELTNDKEYIEDITVEFDDSIIHDKEQEDKELDFQLMNGLISEVYYWQMKLGLTEELAIEFVNKQRELKELIEVPAEEGNIEE